MPWQSSESFNTKLLRLNSLINKFYSSKNKISLVGTSAGGSAVINAYINNPTKIYKVVNVCGRLKEGVDVMPTLKQAGKKSFSFIESVKLVEKNSKLLTREQRNNILTIRPIFDEIVPPVTTTIDGAENIQIISGEHMLSICLALTLYKKKIINFINS